MTYQGAFTIGDPVPGDEVAIGPMHTHSWHESYLNTDAGITPEIIDAAMSHMTLDEANEFRANTFKEAREMPNKVLYRVVKDTSGKVVGFMHGSKNDSVNELEGIYLLNAAKGQGVGSALMEEFLAWADQQKPCHLEVIAYNNRALHFYEKFGFKKTDRPVEMFKQHFPVVEMLRPV